jgi:transcription elongation factor GreA
MNKIPLTKIGAEKLREELHNLKTVERPAVLGDTGSALTRGSVGER